jgi:hypothetical protein
MMKYTIDELLNHAERRISPEGLDGLDEALGELVINVRQQFVIVYAATTLYRVRRLDNKTNSTTDLGAPPLGIAPMGRLNMRGESVLYLSDSPETAFAEIRATTGAYCVSQWQTMPDKLAIANGGIAQEFRARYFGESHDPNASEIGGVDDQRVLQLLEVLFTLDVGTQPELYGWSIATGRANGFAAVCQREGKTEINGNTIFNGRYPFAGLAYPSVRCDKKAINCALNDEGQRHVQPKSAQWIEIDGHGSHKLIDSASVVHGELVWSDQEHR